MCRGRIMGNETRKIEIYDSTLRDGAQGEGVSFSLSDKIKIIKLLDEFGVDYIEAGNPGSNIKDVNLFKELKNIKLKHSVISAFGHTARIVGNVKDDKNIHSLMEADTNCVCIFGKAWDMHVKTILDVSKEENLCMVYDTVKYLKSLDKEVIFDAEHFFDGYKSDNSYSLSVVSAAFDAGADTVCLCDTNGGTLNNEISDITEAVKNKFQNKKLAIHCHNDTGCAVASSLGAVINGVCQVQGTFLGFGERCGNANLSSIIPNLVFKLGLECNADLPKLKSTARKIAEISNLRILYNEPYIGKSAFTHKAGMHIDGVQKCPSTFEHIDPTKVGNERHFVLSENSGKGSILPIINKFEPNITKQSALTADITQEMKRREYFGYKYEGAEASFELFVKKQLGLWQPHFKVIMYKCTDDFPAPDGEQQSSAMIKLEVNGQTELTCECGNGPVNALDKALRKAITVFYPHINNVKLTDFKVRVIDATSTSGAKVRVLVESSDSKNSFTTIGVSFDIIEASFIAIVDSLEYALSIQDKGNS